MSKIIPADRFRVIATQGIGRLSASTAHSMAYFRGQLYVGTSCGQANAPDDAPRILRYDAAANDWQTVYTSPLIEPTVRSHVPDRQVALHGKGADLSKFTRRRDGAGKLPRDVGYRSMFVFQGRSDPAPALYVTSMSRTGGVILRSLDGENFDIAGEVGLGNRDIFSFRGLAQLGPYLFTAPAGTVTDEYLDRNLAPETKVLVTDDPAGGQWRDASESGFGDPANLAIFALATAHDMIYAGTANPERGLQVWRTRAQGEPPFEWLPVIIDGGDAFNHNLAVSAMTEFNGALYVGGGISGFGYDTVHDVGPASAELIRIHADGSWDLIAGRMRFTRDGLKVPLSLLGPGLGDFYNSVVWALGAHEGVLYLGTHQWEPFQSLKANSEKIVGGYQLWASEDGENWEMVIEDGRGNPAELGVRTLRSTPLGLFVGTHNHARLLQLLGARKRDDLDFKAGFQVLLGK